MVAFIATVFYVALLLYFFILWARFLLDLARNFSRSWRPTGVLLVISVAILTLTDPPMKLVRRILPPVRFGAAALDFSWSIVMIVVIVLMYVALIFS
ncbi:MAG: YggT family protein [Cryobacterium sp.]|nr:YggT family protein [Cryobacterium sp.]MBX3090658.1 YggT family protein [Cryobacterium sp.]MBX3116049.1 YggT family protein [Cryobacterium sp.]MCW5944167.1 YggT family protein [Cryobacterium sp.]